MINITIKVYFVTTYDADTCNENNLHAESNEQ